MQLSKALHNFLWIKTPFCTNDIECSGRLDLKKHFQVSPEKFASMPCFRLRILLSP